MRSKKEVDKNASSVMVALHAQRRRRKMAHEYEIEYQGKKIRCKSVAAAVRLLRELGEDKSDPWTQPWSVSEFQDFVGRIQLYQRRLLAFLFQHKRNRLTTDGELREHLKIKSNKALAGVLSGVSKVAMALDIEPGRVYRQWTTYIQGKPVRHYSTSEGFRRAAVDNDWPSEDDLEAPEYHTEE